MKNINCAKSTSLHTNLLQRLRPETVILDIRLPESSGIIIIKDIKERHLAVTVIISTNFDVSRYRRLHRQFDADHFRNKALAFERTVKKVTGA